MSREQHIRGTDAYVFFEQQFLARLSISLLTLLRVRTSR